MIDPSFNSYPNYQSFSKDKAGKTNNYRGVTYYNSNLYFTKGSGSNGIDTVYTVSNPGRPVADRGDRDTATISILPGFPTDSAKETGANLAPFAVFFAKRDHDYVADEGTGATRSTSRAMPVSRSGASSMGLGRSTTRCRPA